MGIPLLIMELGLGQKYQRGDVSVFRNINKRLAGIGIVSVYSAYFITFYYNVIIAWSCVYAVSAFFNPLPWSPSEPHACMELAKTDPKFGKLTRAEVFFHVDVTNFYDPVKCTPW